MDPHPRSSLLAREPKKGRKGWDPSRSCLVPHLAARPRGGGPLGHLVLHVTAKGPGGWTPLHSSVLSHTNLQRAEGFGPPRPPSPVPHTTRGGGGLAPFCPSFGPAARKTRGRGLAPLAFPCTAWRPRGRAWPLPARPFRMHPEEGEGEGGSLPSSSSLSLSIN